VNPKTPGRFFEIPYFVDKRDFMAPRITKGGKFSPDDDDTLRRLLLIHYNGKNAKYSRKDLRSILGFEKAGQDCKKINKTDGQGFFKEEWKKMFEHLQKNNVLGEEDIRICKSIFAKKEKIITDVENLAEELKDAGYSNDPSNFASLANKYFCYFPKTFDEDKEEENQCSYNKGELTINGSSVEFILPSSDNNEKAYAGSIIFGKLQSKDNVTIRLFRHDKNQAADLSSIMFQLSPENDNPKNDVLVALCLTTPAEGPGYLTVHRMILSKYELNEDILKTILPLLKMGNDDFYIKKEDSKKVIENIQDLKGKSYSGKLETSIESSGTFFHITESMLENANEGKKLTPKEKANIFSILGEHAKNVNNYLNIKEETHFFIRDYIHDLNQNKENDEPYKEETGVFIGPKETFFFEGGTERTTVREGNSAKNKEESKTSKSKEPKLVLESYPRRLVLEITNSCHFNCQICYGSRGDTKENLRLSYGNFLWFAPLFNVVEEVTLFGVGEPDVHGGFSEMLKELKKHQVRKYFCTSGISPDKYRDDVSTHHVENLAFSINSVKTNNDKIPHGKSKSLEDIREHLEYLINIKEKKESQYPYIRIKYCLMKDNLEELPALVEEAVNIGVNNVKVVYMTAFKNKDNPKEEEENRAQILWNDRTAIKEIYDEIKNMYKRFEKEGKKIRIDLPFPPGEDDDAKEQPHRYCDMAWKDFFLDADGWIRPCMSTNEKFFELREYTSKPFSKEVWMEMWNHQKFQEHRRTVNDFEHPEKMSKECRYCYQTSHANWNKKYAFDQCDIS